MPNTRFEKLGYKNWNAVKLVCEPKPEHSRFMSAKDAYLYILDDAGYENHGLPELNSFRLSDTWYVNGYEWKTPIKPEDLLVLADRDPTDLVYIVHLEEAGVAFIWLQNNGLWAIAYDGDACSYSTDPEYKALVDIAYSHYNFTVAHLIRYITTSQV